MPATRDLGDGFKRAKEDWKAGRFGGVPGDPEFIPLPEERKPRVDYP